MWTKLQSRLFNLVLYVNLIKMCTGNRLWGKIDKKRTIWKWGVFGQLTSHTSPGQKQDTNICSSSVAGICLKNISCQTVSQALKIFLGIIPAPAKLKSDFGPEFSNFFTMTCNQYGIEHSNKIPRRSQSQGSCELGIKLLK